jgi:hypothetical protein
MRVVKGPILLTAFGELELTNAFELRLFRRELTASEIAAARSALREDLEGGVFWFDRNQSRLADMEGLRVL